MPIGDDLGDSGDADLVVVVVEVDQLDPRVGRDLDRLVVAPQVGDIDRETVGPDRRDGADPGLVAVDRGQVREPRLLHHAERQVPELLRGRRVPESAWSWSSPCYREIRDGARRDSRRGPGVTPSRLAPGGDLPGAVGPVAQVGGGGGADAGLGRGSSAACRLRTHSTQLVRCSSSPSGLS